MGQQYQKSNARVVVAGIVIVAIIIAASIVYLETRPTSSPNPTSPINPPQVASVVGRLVPPAYPQGYGSSCSYGCYFTRIDFTDSLSRQNASAALNCINDYGGSCSYSITLSNMRTYLVTAPYSYGSVTGYVCSGGSLDLDAVNSSAFTFNVNC